MYRILTMVNIIGSLHIIVEFVEENNINYA